MSQDPRPSETEEKRHSIRCAKCGTLMVCMNKYVLLENGHIYLYYICPRRKGDNETGCGHKTFVEIRKNNTSAEEVELSAGMGMIGHVRITDKVAMVIQDNLETFETWLYKNSDKFKDKKVEITVQIKEKNSS